MKYLRYSLGVLLGFVLSSVGFTPFTWEFWVIALIAGLGQALALVENDPK